MAQRNMNCKHSRVENPFMIKLNDHQSRCARHCSNRGSESQYWVMLMFKINLRFIAIIALDSVKTIQLE